MEGDNMGTDDDTNGVDTQKLPPPLPRDGGIAHVPAVEEHWTRPLNSLTTPPLTHVVVQGMIVLTHVTKRFADLKRVE
ncbi:hypothetical protein GBAR_LOCUS31880 [Geodia barretti]|uniref:Uncharacterized protein n=1 Tax=Geodia barretti TaxID=519541 RepID=A0AA35U331_GEOBA|nr:hypothetical protein GBAR_LOCUS31880 [Geodia barretti]